MKKQLFIFFLLYPILLCAEVVEHENILKLKYGGVWQVDPYLSPLRYSGQAVGGGNEWWQSFSKHEHWSHVGAIDLTGQWSYNVPKTNRLWGLGVHAGWGAYRHWDWEDKGLQVIVGPYLEGELMARYLTSNFNKPYSMDLGIQAQVMMGASWSFGGKKTSYRLRYLAHLNVIGVDFMPDYFASYYELSEGVLQGTVRCAGLWNHQSLRHELTMDLQFPHSTWRVGAEHIFLNYGTKDMQFHCNQVSLIVGCIFRYKVKPAERFR